MRKNLRHLLKSQLNDDQKREAIRLFREEQATARRICREFQISPATCYRLRALARTPIEHFESFRRPGWRRVMTVTERKNLQNRVRQEIAARVEASERDIIWQVSRPKKAKPTVHLHEVRAIAAELGIICSDSTLLRCLRQKKLMTVGQKRFRRRQVQLRNKLRTGSHT